MKAINTIYERLKARLAFVFPVAVKEYSTNNTVDEVGMSVYVKTPTEKYLAISNGDGTITKLSPQTITLLSQEGTVRITVDGVFKTKHLTPAFELEATGEAANNKKWDMVVQGNGLYLRAIDDAGQVGIAMRIDRENRFPSLVTFPNIQVAGADATQPTHFATLGQLDAALTITSPNATDLATTMTLLNEIKSKLNAL